MARRSIRTERANRRSVVLAVIAAVVFVLILAFQIRETRKENNALQLNMQALQESVKEEEAKGESLDALQNQGLSEDEVVDIAHDRFGLVFPNEIVLIPED